MAARGSEHLYGYWATYWAAYFLDTSVRPGSKCGMHAVVVKALQVSACGVVENAYG